MSHFWRLTSHLPARIFSRRYSIAEVNNLNHICGTKTCYFMMTDTLETAYPFFARINPEKEGQIFYWAQKFSIDEKELRNIISIAGPVVKDIHDYLQTL